jgi:N-methylhydantoinase A/oxoprolinase/acetone carboxylase beta subunit
MEGVKEGRTLRFSIDRGGTFTDVFAEVHAHAGAVCS